MSEKLRLSLTFKALEALLGGDSEIEVELRQSVVNAFTDKYLKGVVASEQFSKECHKLQNVVAEETRKAIAAKLGQGAFSQYSEFKLDESVVRRIDRLVTVSIGRAIDKAFAEALTEQNEKITRWVHNAITGRISELAKYYVMNADAFKKDLDAVVEAEFKRRLEALK